MENINMHTIYTLDNVYYWQNVEKFFYQISILISIKNFDKFVPCKEFSLFYEWVNVGGHIVVVFMLKIIYKCYLRVLLHYMKLNSWSVCEELSLYKKS